MIQITRSRNPLPTRYFLHGQVLETVASSKYLGVNISNDLSWNSHVQRVCASANRTLGFLKRNIRSKDPGLRETAYKALVRPQVEYSSPVWSPYTKRSIDQIEMVQRRAARWTLGNYSTYASVTDMVQTLGWRPLEARRSDARLVLFYKIVHGLVAVPIPPYVQHPLRIPRRSHDLCFRQIPTSTDYYKYSFYPLAIVQWNRLPSNIALLPSLESFRQAVSSVPHSMP